MVERLAGWARYLGWLCLALLLMSCSRDTTEPQTGVSLELAREREQRVADVQYQLRFVIPGAQQEPVDGRVRISFELAAGARPLQLDFRAPQGSIRSLRSNGEQVDYRFLNEHIVLPDTALRAGRNEVTIDFVAGSSSLNRNPDYLYSLLVPDRARTVFPLFDQPDLKARFELTLVVPAGWLAVSSAPVVAVDEQGEQAVYRFAPSEPISSYLFSFVAGRFEAVTREVGGRSMTLYHRETDRDKLARNLDAIFSQHGAAIAWLEDYTGIPYPFQSFDFVLIPDFPYGGMEHVGAIQYRASLLLLEESPPLTDLLNRAQLIAHETAHMWFGNLVTMRWFDDVWTKEVFASFMADKMVNPAFPEVDHELNFMLSHHPGAYAVDRSEGTNPIRQPLANLNEAGQLYGNIIYNKAPIMMRQLELLVGERGLRDGLRQYLQQYAFANASWPELIAILDEHSDRDLAAWSDAWVNTAGRPQFVLTPLERGGQLRQLDTAGLGRVWPQQFGLLRLYPQGSETSTLLVEQPLIPLPAGADAAPPEAILFNSDGRGYGLFPAQLSILESWQSLEAVQRGAALINAYEQLLAGAPFEPAAYTDLLLDIVETEQDPLLLELALEQLHFVYFSLLDDRYRECRGAQVEARLWSALLAQPDSSRTKLLFRYFAALASTPAGVQRLHRIWAGEQLPERLQLGEEDRARLAQLLAIRLPRQASEIMQRQIAATENPDRRRRLQYLAPSVSADPAERDAFFASLEELRNRRPESWVLEALGNLYHPARLESSQQYLLPSLELLPEIQATGDIFFPGDWLQVSLANYNSPEVAALVRAFLAGHPNLSPRLRMLILQAADPLFRSSGDSLLNSSAKSAGCPVQSKQTN